MEQLEALNNEPGVGFPALFDTGVVPVGECSMAAAGVAPTASHDLILSPAGTALDSGNQMLGGGDDHALVEPSPAPHALGLTLLKHLRSSVRAAGLLFGRAGSVSLLGHESTLHCEKTPSNGGVFR